MSSMGKTDKSISSSAAPISSTAGDTTQSIASQEPLKRRPHKAKSDIWEHFTKLSNNLGKANRTVCTYCNASYTYASVNGTSTLWKHLEKCGKYPFNKDKKQKTLTFQTGAQGGENTLSA